MSIKAREGTYTLRFMILKRDAFTCQYCGQYAPNVVLHVDHKVPLCEGGTNDEANLITSCAACNRGKEGLRLSQITRDAKGRFPKGGGIAEQVIRRLEKGPASIRNLTEAVGKNANAVQMALWRMKERGLAVKRDGVWELVQT